MKYAATFLAAAMAATIAGTTAFAQHMVGDLVIVDAWTRATPPSARNGGAFMTIHNKGGEPDRLVAARTPVSKVTELHTHLMEEGMMKMRPVTGIEIPVGGSAELKPGSLHVMMLGLNEPLAEGTSVPVTLVFEKAGEVTIDVMVMKAGASSHTGRHGDKPMNGHGHGHGNGMKH